MFSFTDPFLALEHSKINAPNCDLVIFDLRMPVMNGYEFVSKVKQINPDVKVCLMSAFEVNELELDLLNSIKIDEFLQKPLSLEKLTEIIGGMLKIYNK